MNDHHHDLPPAHEGVVETLVEEHVHVSCAMFPVDDHTWAIVGSLGVDGDEIVAEFDTHDAADLAVEEIAAAVIEEAPR